MSSDEEDDTVVQTPEFDARIALAIIDALQKRGENMLMDELIEATEADEWEVARVLDVLVSLNIAAVEKQRGNSLRNSRAFAYRNGYSLPKQVRLDTLSQDLVHLETSISEKLEGIAKLKEQLERVGDESDAEFLKSYREGKSTLSEAVSTLLTDKQQ